MAREIRYPDGTVRHVYAGPEARRRRWRPSGTALFVIVALAAVLLARIAGHA
ncbi:hypothetical protein ABH931_006129 [Streptacidiphilus sp. MAP12-33]|uniref:T-complex 10 C-terminal domain-containing protein n=1 Tax=Streptacidiphilus sp. MAP12-33 TaxID=3156266 RepID=UPI0035171CC5